MGVVKTNAYGHGAVVLSRELEALGAKWLAVACADEGVELRENGIRLPVLVLGFTSPDQYGDLLKYDITPTVFSMDMARALNEAAGEAGRTLPIHIKIDTGMGRIGYAVTRENAREIAGISRLANLKLEGMFTHLPVQTWPEKNIGRLRSASMSGIARWSSG